LHAPNQLNTHAPNHNLNLNTIHTTNDHTEATMTGSSAPTPSALQSLVYTPAAAVASNGGNGSGGVPTLAVLDQLLIQLLIPREKAYIDVKTVQDAWQVRAAATAWRRLRGRARLGSNDRSDDDDDSCDE
jgi:hypothetical protein